MRRRRDFERGCELGRAKVEAAGLDPGLAAEAINTYALALHRAYMLRDAWDKAGMPALALGSKGQPVAHPLIAMVESAERHLAAADAALTRSRRERAGNTTGNRLGQHSAPDRAAVTPIRRRSAS